MPRPLIEFLIGEAHRNSLRVVAHTHGLSDFKHLLRSEVNAQILGLDQLGMVAAGKNADFLVLDANPLDNMANTRRVSRVYLRGGEVDRAALKTQLKGRSAAATRSPTTH